MYNIDFEKISTEDLELIEAIAERAAQMYIKLFGSLKSLRVFRIHAGMGLVCVHSQSPLRLKDLLEADDVNFSYDLGEIRTNLNRNTGKLDNFFCPRFSK